MPFAVFFDILGSSRAVESLADDHCFEASEHEFSAYGWARQRFHDGLRIASAVAEQGLRFQASFSDCSYLIYDSPRSLLVAVTAAMSQFYGSVPVRGGVGYGNFGMGTSIHTSSPSGASTEASFYGSSIVRAHAAENSGLKGFRVFVHTSAVQQLSVLDGEDFVYPQVDWSQFEEGDPPRPAIPATVTRLVEESADEVHHELCFIGEDDVQRYLRGVEMMESMFPPDESAVQHHHKSREALHRFETLRLFT